MCRCDTDDEILFAAQSRCFESRNRVDAWLELGLFGVGFGTPFRSFWKVAGAVEGVGKDGKGFGQHRWIARVVGFAKASRKFVHLLANAGQGTNLLALANGAAEHDAGQLLVLAKRFGAGGL